MEITSLSRRWQRVSDPVSAGASAAFGEAQSALRRQTDESDGMRMRQLLLILPMLTAAAPAAPIYLNCHDSTATKIKTVQVNERSDEVINTKIAPQSRRVAIDLYSNEATVSDGPTFLVEPKPNKITLNWHMCEASEEAGFDENEFRAQDIFSETCRSIKMIINRSTLAYKYKDEMNDTFEAYSENKGYEYGVTAIVETFSGHCQKRTFPGVNQI